MFLQKTGKTKSTKNSKASLIKQSNHNLPKLATIKQHTKIRYKKA